MSYIYMSELNADHEVDFSDTTSIGLFQYRPWTTGTKYYYDSTTGVFSTSGSGTEYEQYSINVTAFTDPSDVVAKIKTTDIMTDFFQRISNMFLYLKTSIFRCLNLSGVEILPVLRIFESNSNVNKDEGDNNTFTGYEDLMDVNAHSSITESRLNGTKNFTLPEIPAATRLTKSCSFEVELVNEGRLIEFGVIQSKRTDRGGNG